MMEHMVGEIDRKKCTGCKMCGDICPQHAITFPVDGEGFWYPVVNKEACTSCGLCSERCPALHPRAGGAEDPFVYAAWSKDEKNRITSSSGGVFYEIARAFIEHGGVAAGCVYGEDQKSACHMIAETVEDLERLKGSKYLQSDTEGIYKKVKQELQRGKRVLFSGTPCQNGALEAYLGGAYDGLYQIDFICRGINSPYAVREYLNEFEQKHRSKIVRVELKNKDRGWQESATKVYFENGEEERRSRDSDWWVKGFVWYDMYTRDSCYDCAYRKIPRAVSDITLGDFWGIRNQSKEDMFRGISVVLVNTPKGRCLLENCRRELVLKPHAIEDVLPGNPALIKNPVPSKKKQKFFKLLPKAGFTEATKRSSRRTLPEKGRAAVIRMGRLWNRGWKLLRECDVFKFIYYNFMCPQVRRDKGCYIIPYKNAVLDIHRTARIYVHGKNIEIGINKLRHSKAETHLRMRAGAVWNAGNGCGMFYGTVLEILKDAVFDSGYFTMNGGSVIVCAKHITFGEDVMLGRNIIIYDSDFHFLRNESGQKVNPPEAVAIDDHVWLTSNIVVVKGVHIGRDSLIAAYTSVTKDVPEHSIVAGKSSGKVISDYVNWSRD